MSQTMLINGRHAEELRVAIVDNRVLEMYEVEVAAAGQRRGNIYRGIVANIEPSLDAAFIDIGANRHGFLARHDIVPQAFHRSVGDDKRPRIDQMLQKGQPINVQVTKDEVGQKGATLTTNLSLPGRFLVFLPFEEQRGLSRKVEDEDVRRKVKERARTIELPEKGAGFIIRTNGVDQTKAALKADLGALARLWQESKKRANTAADPSCSTMTKTWSCTPFATTTMRKSKRCW
jgi:ribonuclease E